MLISQGAARSGEIDRRLASLLAGVAGALNAAAFQAVGFFSANMTGNVSALSERLALGSWLSGSFFLAIVALFILGAVISTLLINAGRRRRMHGIYALTILAEAVLLALLGVADMRLSGAQRVPVLILGLSFLMGLQNAVVTRISDARIRTTHVSGMVTDMGIELGVLIDIIRGRELAAGAVANRSKLRLHGQTVLAFFVGGVLGVTVYRVIGGAMLLGAAFLLLWVSASGLWRVRNMA